MPIRHPTRTQPALQPRYVSRFSCIGPSCEDNCCTDWHVSLDKKTFEAYSGSGSERLAKVVRINPEPRTELDFGQMGLTEEKRQCLLLEENLCSAHRDEGEGSLSHTCFSYPRVWTEVGGHGEQSLQLSCLALLAPDAFEFEEGSMTVRPDAVRTAHANAGFTAEAINEARYFCINLMRARELELWQRLAVLGLFCESLDEPVARHDGQAIFELVEKFTALLLEGALLDSLAPLQPDHAAQAMVFSLLWQGMSRETPNAVRRHVVDAVASGLGADPLTGQVEAERLVERYREGRARLPDALQAARNCSSTTCSMKCS